MVKRTPIEKTRATFSGHELLGLVPIGPTPHFDVCPKKVSPPVWRPVPPGRKLNHFTGNNSLVIYFLLCCPVAWTRSFLVAGGSGVRAPRMWVAASTTTLMLKRRKDTQHWEQHSYPHTRCLTYQCPLFLRLCPSPAPRFPSCTFQSLILCDLQS